MSTNVQTAPRRARTTALLGVALATGLSGAVAVSTASPASAQTPGVSRYGTLSGTDGTLPPANKCGSYAYSWDLTPPPGTWDLQTLVTDPRGNTVTSMYVIDAYSPTGTKGSTPFTLCTNNTAAGTFTVAGTLTVDDGTGRVTTYQLAPGTFQLSPAPPGARATKHKHKHKKKHHGKKKQGTRTQR